MKVYRLAYFDIFFSELQNDINIRLKRKLIFWHIEN